MSGSGDWDDDDWGSWSGRPTVPGPGEWFPGKASGHKSGKGSWRAASSLESTRSRGPSQGLNPGGKGNSEKSTSRGSQPGGEVRQAILSHLSSRL